MTNDPRDGAAAARILDSIVQLGDNPAPDGVRVIAVVNWRRGRVHGITCDQAEARQWWWDIFAENGGDPLAAGMCADVVYPPTKEN